MAAPLNLQILRQPDDQTCGPTCLHALYAYYGDVQPLTQVISETRMLKEGGTIAANLACHALRRGYKAKIYTYNLAMFDPTWFSTPGVDIGERLERQLEAKPDPKRRAATEGYIEFLGLGGRMRFEDLTTNLLRRYLKRGVPILTGLSATYLYRCAREYGPRSDYDDVRGEPMGHFVVLAGYDRVRREVTVADPLHDNPGFESHKYQVNIDRLIGAIFLGVLTYDANLLIIEPKGEPETRRRDREGKKAGSRSSRGSAKGGRAT